MDVQAADQLASCDLAVGGMESLVPGTAVQLTLGPGERMNAGSGREREAACGSRQRRSALLEIHHGVADRLRRCAGDLDLGSRELQAQTPISRRRRQDLLGDGGEVQGLRIEEHYLLFEADRRRRFLIKYSAQLGSADGDGLGCFELGSQATVLLNLLIRAF